METAPPREYMRTSPARGCLGHGFDVWVASYSSPYARHFADTIHHLSQDTQYLDQRGKPPKNMTLRDGSPSKKQNRKDLKKTDGKGVKSLPNNRR